MKGRFLLHSYHTRPEPNIYADKSSLILEWLLFEGIEREVFSIREVAREKKVSIGLVQRVFNALIQKGILKAIGMRTAKKFALKKPTLLLKSWLEQYSIVERCRMWTYQSALQDREEILKVLFESKFHKQVAFALHSAAEAYGCKNTNLETLELYILDPRIKTRLEEKLALQPQERGYEVLLVEPYYKMMLSPSEQTGKFLCTSPLLTFLDLYHFPLRGIEQAEFMADRVDFLKRIYV